MNALCEGRQPCEFVGRTDGGTDPSGRGLMVVELALAEAAVRGPSFGDECTPFEHHLARFEGDTLVDHRLLLEVCNDGYGASGVGDDRVEVRDNRFIHEQSGGSSWRWSRGTVEQLWPAKLIVETTSSYRSPMGHESTSRWNWETMSGVTSWSFVRCGDEEGAPLEGSAVLLPLAPPVEGWPDKGLGRCAARIDSSGTGHIIHGVPAEGPEDASLSASLTPLQQLRIEVLDDTFVREADSWLFVDHIELWLPQGQDPSDLHCIDRWPAQQWGIDLDGKVYPARGEPDASALSATVQVEQGRARFTIQLPEGEHERITVVYSDSDDGKTQERLLATSALDFGNAHSLGPLRDLTKTPICTPESDMRRFWDPTFRELLGKEDSEALLEARLAIDRITTSTELLAAFAQAQRTLPALNRESAKWLASHPEVQGKAFDWATRQLPGWSEDAGVWSLDLEVWLDRAGQTPNTDDDAFVKRLLPAPDAPAPK